MENIIVFTLGITRNINNVGSADQIKEHLMSKEADIIASAVL
jgi:hypothetical protein